jgi:polar amino acid transport system permease protein
MTRSGVRTLPSGGPRSRRDPSGPDGGTPGDPIQAVPVRHPMRWVGGIVVLVLIAMAVHTVIYNPRFQWGVVGQYFTSQAIIGGVELTLLLTVVSMLIGIVGGTLLAIIRLSPNPLLGGFAGVYVWLFRGTPLLVQLLFWNFLQALFPTLSIGIPFGPSFWSFHASSLITPIVAAVLGLGLNEAAYMSEIVRAGILSVDDGQVDASLALGFRRLQVMRIIVLPQAMRVIIPPTGNQTIGMLKTSSLASVIAIQELLYSAQIIYSRTYQTMPLLIVASLWYIILTSVLSVGQYYLERHFGRGARTVRTSLPEALGAGLRQAARRLIKPGGGDA